MLQITTGKMNAFGWLRYSGFARNEDPELDAVTALAALIVFSLNLTGLDILQKTENRDNAWWLTCTTTSTLIFSEPVPSDKHAAAL